MTLFQRVAAMNAGGILAAALVLALTPVSISAELARTEALVLAIGTTLLIVVNTLLLRRVLGPVARLAVLMGRVDPMQPGLRVEVDHAVGEVAALCDAFNAMLDRLEDERRESGRRALLAQEAERRRLARELHDEVGQTLTGVVLQLDGLGRRAPADLAAPITQLQETAREGVEDVREIVRGLRPQALDEFGLRSALVALAEGFTERSGIRVRTRLAADVPALEPEQDLAIYRVAQEALTNVARHAGATEAELALEYDDGGVLLRVTDDGRGIGASPGEGAGLGGMRERALLIGGRLVVRPRDGKGTEVRLTVPA